VSDVPDSNRFSDDRQNVDTGDFIPYRFDEILQFEIDSDTSQMTRQQIFVVFGLDIQNHVLDIAGRLNLQFFERRHYDQLHIYSVANIGQKHCFKDYLDFCAFQLFGVVVAREFFFEFQDALVQDVIDKHSAQYDVESGINNDILHL
jgi:hypothetical protein